MPPALVKKTELGFKKFLHRLFGLILGKGDRSKIPVRSKNIRSVLILRPDKLGDMITTVPTAHALREKFPLVRIEIIASPLNRQLVDNDPCFDAVHIYRKNIFHDLPLIWRLRREQFDIIFDPICHDSVTGLLLSKLISNNSVLAAARKLELSSFYDYCEPYQPDGEEHNIDNSLLLFNVLGIAPESIDPFRPVYLPDACKRKADEFMAALEADRSFLIGINISAGSPTRSLASSKYAALIDRILREDPRAQVVVVCTMADRDIGLELTEGRGPQVRIVPEGLSLLEAAAIIGRFDLFISPDTSLIHMARLMKVPVVGLYCSHKRNYHFWKPYRQEHGSVLSSHPGHIHDIEADEIYEELMKLTAQEYPEGTGRIVSSRR